MSPGEFRRLASGRPWPGLSPGETTRSGWPEDLKVVWRALRSADDAFAIEHPRAPQPSFAVWRIIAGGERPLPPDHPMAEIEQAALQAGLDALAGVRLLKSEETAEIPANEGNQRDMGGPSEIGGTPPRAEAVPLGPNLDPMPCRRVTGTQRHDGAGVIATVAKITPGISGVKGKRGRPARESALSLRVRGAMTERGIPSIGDLESRAGISTDSFRDILRGRTGRNRTHKLGIVEKVAVILHIPLSELAELAGLIEIHKRVDRGTTELQLRRDALAAGGDARLCWSALGVLLAHGDVEGRLGITRSQHDTGRKFADLIARSLPGAPKMPRSELERFAYPGGRREADEVAVERRVDVGRLAWKALLRSDREAAKTIIGPRPSLMAWSIAVRDELPGWAQPWATAPWSKRALSEWEALSFGLKALRHHFALDAGHRAIVTELSLRQGNEGRPDFRPTP